MFGVGKGAVRVFGRPLTKEAAEEFFRLAAREALALDAEALLKLEARTVGTSLTVDELINLIKSQKAAGRELTADEMINLIQSQRAASQVGAPGRGGVNILRSPNIRQIDVDEAARLFGPNAQGRPLTPQVRDFEFFLNRSDSTLILQ